MKSAALVIVTLMFVLVFQAASIPYFQGPTIAHADPAMSGAITAQVPNGDFSGVGLGDVGTPPTNYDVETPSNNLGAFSNHDFASGDFTGWTLTGSPTIQTGGPGGNYAQLTSGTRIKSPAFTVASNAQSMSFQMAAVSSGTFQVKLVIYSGAGYATTTTKYFTSCPTTCTTWQQYQFDAVAWQGQSIQVEIQRYLGDLKVDDVAAQVEVMAGWTATGGESLTRQSGGPSGSYVQTKSASVISPAFTVDSQAQNGSVDTKVVSGSAGYSVYVLSGPTFATSTQVYSGSGSDTSWGTRTFGLGSFAGQSVKLKVTAGTSTLAVDGLGVAKNVVPGWSAAGTGVLQLGSEGGLGYVSNVSSINSGTFMASGTGYNGNTRGNWFRIVYRMKYNYNPQNNDIGSTLNVWVPGDPSPWFTKAGKQSGAPYEPTDVWIEKYFFVIGDLNNIYVPTARAISFKVVGWPYGYSTCGSLGCEGSPDVATIEMVDGPGENKVLGNGDSILKPAIPRGFAYRTDVTDENGDPVELTSGTYFQAKTDLAIPGRGVPLTFTRSYSAAAATNTLGSAGPMGAKWSHNWQASLKEFDTDKVRISLPAGASSVWYKVGGVWKPPTGMEGTLVKNAGGDWTLTTAGQLVYAFDSSGKWTSVKDRNNNTTSLAYDGSGRLSTITDPGSRSLTLTYGTSGNGDGRIVNVSDGARSVSYGYSSAGDLTTITDVMGGTIAYQYAGHLLTQGTDAKGNVFVRNTYDTKGRVSQQLDAAGGTTTFAYDTPGAGATRVTDQRGKQTTYYFDQQMRITDVKDHDGGVTTTVYDANNNKTSVTNPLGKTWSYTYDSRHNVLTATDPLAKVWTYTYNARNDVLTVTDPLTRVTTYAYDGSGNLASITDANSKITSFTVNANGLVTAVTDPLAHATSFDYDSYGNRTTITNALNKTWTYAYDSFGRVTSVTDPLTHATSYTYNSANLVLTVSDPLSHVTTYAYDANGNVLTVTDANTKVTSYAYNNKEQLTSLTDAASGVMSFGYDAVGNLTTKTNPRSKTTTYSYDNLGRLASESDPLSHVRSYGYDAGSRLTSRTDAKSQTVSYTYNNRNELTNITYPDLSYTSFAYNDAGARTQMVDGTGATTYSYDSLYRLTSVTFPGSRTVSYSYDDASRRTAITYPGGTNQVSYAYDAANQLTSVTDWGSNSISHAYDDAGRLTSKTLPTGTGVVSSYAYDTADRLTGITHVKDGSTTIASVSYTLDAVGNRTQRSDQQGTHTYAYDNLYRLTSVTYPGPSTTSYAFDAFGNRTSMTNSSGTTAYAFDDADRITSVTPPSPAPVVSYTWDNNGNLTNRGSDTFSWDYEDRMTSATVNSVTTSFAYRGDGLRDSRTTGGNATTFTWDVNRGLPVVLDDGSQYVYGAGLTAMKQSGSWFYYLADGLGSTMAIVDSAGGVQKGYTYDVYGKPTATGTLANEFDFAGQQTDGTGLQYLRARYVDPETGTFLSREPMAVLPGWGGNPFGYGASSPSRFTDPSGLYPTDERGCRTDDRADPYCVGDDNPGSIHSAVPSAAGCGPGGALFPHCDRFMPPYPCDAHQSVPSGTCANVGGDGSHDLRGWGRLGEYAMDLYVGCRIAPELCAATLGGRASAQLALVKYACKSPGTCATALALNGLLSLASAGATRELRTIGREERERAKAPPSPQPQ